MAHFLPQPLGNECALGLKVFKMNEHHRTIGVRDIAYALPLAGASRLNETEALVDIVELGSCAEHYDQAGLFWEVREVFPHAATYDFPAKFGCHELVENPRARANPSPHFVVLLDRALNQRAEVKAPSAASYQRINALSDDSVASFIRQRQ
jgi:hypothetical protein